jgi:hypothetical protein
MIRDDDDGIDYAFDRGCSQTGLDLTINSANFALFTGMALKLFIKKFFQVQVDGRDLFGLAISDYPFGHYCTFISVQSPLPSVCFNSQLAKRWYMQKGGRLAPDKDSNEQQQNIVENDQDAEKSMKKSARKSCKLISFLKDISHIWTALLGLVIHASLGLNVDFRSICWVGGSYEESRCRGDGFCRSDISGVNCRHDNNIRNSGSCTDYDHFEQGTDGYKIVHSSNLAKGTRGGFDADDPGRSCNRKRKRRLEEDAPETQAK